MGGIARASGSVRGIRQHSAAMSESRECQLPGCQVNAVNQSDYCSEHLATGAVVDALTEVRDELHDLRYGLERIASAAQR